jgi:hypothetical protein
MTPTTGKIQSHAEQPRQRSKKDHSNKTTLANAPSAVERLESANEWQDLTGLEEGTVLELVLSPQRCFQQRCDVEMPPSLIRHTESSFHPETTPRGWGRCQSLTATPPRRETTPEGAVVASTDTSQAGHSSKLLHI